MERSEDLSMDQSFLQSLEDIVLSNLENEQFGAEDLSKEIGLSRSQVHRKLQKINGKSITQFIRENRLDVAHDLLNKEVGTAAEISYRVGFSSPAYFTKCFHDYFGYPPSEAKDRSKDSGTTSHGSELKLSKIKRKFLQASIGILLISIGVFLVWQVTPKASITQFIAGNKTKIDPSIAILPITYLSMEEDKQYMADGVMNVITSNLVKIKELKVIAGTSVQRYKEHNKDVRDIGRELDVSYILEVSFQLEGHQARLIIHLINSKDGSSVWSNEYDRKWEDIFEVQSEVSQTIADEIAVTISPETKRIFEESPTNDLSAYEFYLRGKEYYDRGVGEEDHRLAMQMYEKAIERDSSFTLAWVGLAVSSRSLYWWGFDRNQNRIELTRKFLDQAIQLNSNLVEVEMEHARYICQIERKFEDALKIFEKLNSKYPRDAEIYLWMASIWLRMGDFDKALEHYMHALNLDPTNWHFLINVGYFHIHLRDFQQAEETFLKIVELYPAREAGYWGIYHIYYLRGEIGKLNEMLNNYNIPIDSLTLQIEADLLDENYEAAILKILDRDDYVRIDFSNYYSNNYLLGLYYYLASENERAKKYFYKEKLFLENKLQSTKNDVRIYCSLGIVYAGLGDKKKAIEAGERAIEICDATRRPTFCFAENYMARIYLMLGEYDKGIEILETLLGAPVGGITAESVKIHYDWRFFMKNEKFRALVNDPRYQIKNKQYSN